MNSPILILDTETLGLDIEAPVWEVAAIRIDPVLGPRHELELLVSHDPGDWVETLPTSFQEDYRSRFDFEKAYAPEHVADRIAYMARGGAIVMGSKPSFDVDRIEKLDPSVKMPWHHHPLDIPTLVHGYLCGKGVFPAPPWKSDFLSQMIGVDPRDFERHTAMGDVKWCLAMWQKVTGS